MSEQIAQKLELFEYHELREKFNRYTEKEKERANLFLQGHSASGFWRSGRVKTMENYYAVLEDSAGEFILFYSNACSCVAPE